MSIITTQQCIKYYFIKGTLIMLFLFSIHKYPGFMTPQSDIIARIIKQKAFQNGHGNKKITFEMTL